jgi:hypothetical protein
MVRAGLNRENAILEVPTRIIILLSGIPATRKSTFGRYLAREHGFAHYDLECYPRGWPKPELKQIWDNDLLSFVAKLLQDHGRVALDWGFPVSCISLVKELQAAGVKLIWFDGDLTRARQAFIERGGIAVAAFDCQGKEIQQAGLPQSLDCVVVPALSANGVFLDQRQIESLVFP